MYKNEASVCNRGAIDEKLPIAPLFIKMADGIISGPIIGYETLLPMKKVDSFHCEFHGINTNKQNAKWSEVCNKELHGTKYSALVLRTYHLQGSVTVTPGNYASAWGGYPLLAIYLGGFFYYLISDNTNMIQVSAGSGESKTISWTLQEPKLLIYGSMQFSGLSDFPRDTFDTVDTVYNYYLAAWNMNSGSTINADVIYDIDAYQFISTI